MIGKLSLLTITTIIIAFGFSSCNAISNSGEILTSKYDTRIYIVENDFKLKLDRTNTYIITEYFGENENVFIPSAASDGLPIISIGTAFINNTKVKSIILSDNIEYVSKMDFSGCSNLESLHIGAGVTEIEANETLAYCNNLINITVSEDNPVYYSENNCIIERGTKKLILGCKGSVIPDYIEEIGSCAFFAIESLTEIIIPDSVKKIGDFAFFGCSSLDIITIKPEVEYIDQIAFGNCINLTIYCSMPEKPQAWEENWASYRNVQTKVIWQTEITQ